MRATATRIRCAVSFSRPRRRQIVLRRRQIVLVLLLLLVIVYTFRADLPNILLHANVIAAKLYDWLQKAAGTA